MIDVADSKSRIRFKLSKHINIHHILVPIVCFNFIIKIIITILN